MQPPFARDWSQTVTRLIVTPDEAAARHREATVTAAERTIPDASFITRAKILAAGVELRADGSYGARAMATGPQEHE